jgi:hypothetical protein
LFKAARQNGWTPRTEPYYPSEGEPISDDTRDKIRRIVRRFLDSLLDPKKYRNDVLDMWFYEDWIASGGDEDAIEWPPLVWAMKVVTGGGKTTIVIEEIARWLRTHPDMTPLIYAVPHHALGDEITQQFVDLGIDARHFRGYLAVDPNSERNKRLLALDPDTPEHELDRMCATPKRVELAAETKSEIAPTTCKCGKNVCPFYEGKRCAYRAQEPEEGDEPQVWVVTGDLLFHTHTIFEQAKAVIIDESFWQKGLRGLPDKKRSESEWTIPLAVLSESESRDEDDCGYYRRLLAKALETQNYNGGVRRRFLADALDLDDCRHAINAEWKEAEAQRKLLGLHPGMSEGRFLCAKERREVIDAIRLARHLITIWQEIQTLLRNDNKISGRLRLGKKKQQLRLVSWRGIEPIKKPYCKLPTLLIDAVLPDDKIVRRFYPQVEVKADINARASPYTHTRQILEAPFASWKLNSDANLELAWRYIMQEWLLAGRCDTLVICQQKAENWLRVRGLPDNVFVEHYYNLCGLDRYKTVALGILLGRPAPGPRDIEEIAGALSGVQQQACVRAANGFVWYPPQQRGIRLANGDGRRTRGDRHPAPLGESIRWQTCEAELINAYGRLRAILRTADKPCTIRLLFDTCLPITVDEVTTWREPWRLAEAAALGLVPREPSVLMKLYPTRFKTLDAARWALKDGAFAPPGFEIIEYYLLDARGREGRTHVAYYDPTMVADPVALLQERLGCPLERRSF